MSHPSNSNSPECPNCGSKLSNAQIDLVKPFPCPSCAKKLAVSETYMWRLRRTAEALTLGLSVWLALSNIFLLVLAPIVLVFISMVAGVVSKRIFPPPIDEVVDKSKEARYLFR
jgi:hypothetical protein